MRLPDDLRALYGSVHDDAWDNGLLGWFSPMSLEELITWYDEDDPSCHGWDDWPFMRAPVVFETDPPGHVRRVSRSDRWFTFASDNGMNYALVDLDPAPNGNYGQVLLHGRDFHGPIVYVAASVLDLLRRVVAVMRQTEPDPRPYSRRLGFRNRRTHQTTSGTSTFMTAAWLTCWPPAPIRRRSRTCG